MAIEFDLETDADIDIADLRTFLAHAIDGELGPDNTVFRPGMYLTSSLMEPEDQALTAELFGFRPRIHATYRFANLSEPAERDHNTVVMTDSVLALVERFGGHGLLLFNGEQVVIQWAPDGVVFDSEWEDWNELVEVAPLMANHALRPLAQPLL